MSPEVDNRTRPGVFDLVFLPLHMGRSFAFECSADGTVAIDDLSEAAFSNYLLARALVGREFQAPQVVPRCS
jgi:hypothetical protein